jgi:F-type H+-transporting ATPase subunit delta
MATVSINNLVYAIYESTLNKSGTVLDEYIVNAVNLIKEKHLLGKSEQILKALEKIIDKEEQITRARVTTKSKITDKLKNELEELIKERYKSKETVISYNEDSSLLGGIKLEVGDEIINVTLRNKLNQLQNYLIKN